MFKMYNRQFRNKYSFLFTCNNSNIWNLNIFLAPSKTNILLTLTCFNKKREIELITKSQLTNMLCDTSWSFVFARKFSSSNNVTIFVDYLWWTKPICIFDVKIQNPNQLDSKCTRSVIICIIILEFKSCFEHLNWSKISKEYLSFILTLHKYCLLITCRYHHCIILSYCHLTLDNVVIDG